MQFNKKKQFNHLRKFFFEALLEIFIATQKLIQHLQCVNTPQKITKMFIDKNRYLYKKYFYSDTACIITYLNLIHQNPIVSK